MTANLWKRCVAPAILAAIVILFYWKLTLTNQYAWMESPDLAYMSLPWYQFQATEWRHGSMPLWDPNGFGGQTLIGQAQPGAAYPLNWLLFMFPMRRATPDTPEPTRVIREKALDWYYVITRILAAINCYALCRLGLARSRLACIAASCVFSLGGFIGNMTWVQRVSGAVWAPLVLLFFLRTIRGDRPTSSAALSGFFLGVTWLGGHHQTGLFLSLAMLALWMGSLWAKPRRWRLAALAFITAGLAAAFQLLPMLEFGTRAVRFLGLPDDPLTAAQTVPYTNHELYGMKPIALLGVFLPGLDGDATNPYVGAVALALAVLGAILAWREKHVRLLAGLSIGGILFALGGTSLFHGLLYALVPLLDKARSPNEATLIFALGIAPLTAYGLDAFSTDAALTWSKHIGRVLAGLALILAIISFVFFLRGWSPVVSSDRLMITALSATLACALFAACRVKAIGATPAAAALTALILFELASVSTFNLPHKGPDPRNDFLHRLRDHSDIALFLRYTAREPARIEYDDQVIPYNFGDWFGLSAQGVDAFNAYLASAPADLWRLDIFSPRGRDFLGLRYSLAKASTHDNQRELYTGTSGVKVFENPSAYPRAWAVHDVHSLHANITARQAFIDPAFDPRHSSFVESAPAPPLDSCDSAADQIEVPLHLPNRVRISAHLGCRGLIVISDAFFPGWRATVDGQSAPILEVDGGVRGIVASAGDHTIEMRYRPSSVILGASLSLSAAALVIFLRRRDKPSSPPLS